MSRQDVMKILKRYQKESASAKQKYFNLFEKKMAYRTTKTENPEVTLKMVERVLSKILAKK